MAHDPSISTELCFSAEARARLAAEVDEAGGNEVFSFGTIDDGVLVSVEVVARGSAHEVPVFLERAGDHHVLIHNHPGGDLTPSPADLSIAAEAGARGLGFFIVNDDATRVYRVVEPFDRREVVLLDEGEIERFFAPDGLLAQSFPGFEDRPGQRELALEVARAFNEHRVVAFEAGTGIGKSFAYLVPAILWAVRNQSRVVISTATIALQEQLVHKDLPQLARVLPEEFTHNLIKGRGNYICRRKAGEVARQPELFTSGAEDENWAEEILHVLSEPGDGSLSDLQRVPPPDVWSQFDSSSDQSLKTRCPHYRECFYYEARRRAMTSHIVVVNHHLFFADLRLRRDLGAFDADLVIPGYKRVIFDEAHRMEEVASTHLGAQTSRIGALVTLGRLAASDGGPGRRHGGRGRFHYVASVLAECRELVPLEILNSEVVPKVVNARRRIAEAFDQIQDRIHEHVAPTGEGDFRSDTIRIGEAEGDLPIDVIQGPLVKVRDRLEELRREVMSFWQRLQDAPFAPEESYQACVAEMRSASSGLSKLIGNVATFLAPDDGMVSWVEERRAGRGRNLALMVAPVRVSEALNEALYQVQDTVVMTSATLSVGGAWDYLSDRLGWDLTVSERFLGRHFESPFDFSRQGILGLPTDGPRPDEMGFESSFADMVRRAALAARGRTFVLFTSHRLLRRIVERVGPDLADEGLMVLVQGERPRSELLRRFREAGNAVLFGNQSFWEGVDVPGAALSCVVIAKLPFRVPTHPLERGRIEELEKRGENSFQRLAVPQAALALKQGVGRLIRSRTDRGVVVIADNRLHRKSYGRTFLASLPDFSRHLGSRDEVLRAVDGFFTDEISAETFS